MSVPFRVIRRPSATAAAGAGHSGSAGRRRDAVDEAWTRSSSEDDWSQQVSSEEW
jgi:hypothetical protein